MKENKANQDLRDYASENGVKLWQVAEAFGRSDAQFTRYMRNELSVEAKKAFKDAVNAIKQGMSTDVPNVFKTRNYGNRDNMIVYDQENLNILHERLNAVIKKGNVAETCRKIGMSYGALGNVLGGHQKTSPRIGTLVKIAKATNTSIDYLVGLSPINSLGESEEIVMDCMEKYQKFMTVFECLADDLEELREQTSKRYEYYADLYTELLQGKDS